MTSFTEPLDKILAKIQSLFNSKKQIRAADMQDIQELVHSMKSNIIDTLIPALRAPAAEQGNNPAPIKPSFAEAVKQRPKKQNTKLYIPPQDNASPSHTENIVCSFLQKEKVNAGVHSVHATRNGGVVFNFDANDDISKIAKSIEANVGIKASAKSLSMPKIIVSRIPSSDPPTVAANIKSEIINSNPWLQSMVGDGTFDVLFTYKPKDFVSAVCRVSPDIRQRIIDDNNSLKVGVRVCPVRDHFHIPLCTKCSRFGHKASSCQQESPCCCYCASNQHTHSTCPHKLDLSKHKCTNCSLSKSKAIQESSTQHNAFSKSCPSYSIQLNRMIKQTNWGQGPIPSE